jgi:signal transduction histidine kinase
MHLLVVDDSRADFEIISRELERVRAFLSDAEHCADAASCLAALASDVVDCVLLDYRLGPDSGLDLLTALRRQGYDHPVIMLTGQGDERVAVEAMKRGAQDYLMKDSVTNVVLRRAISNAVQKVLLERSLREKQNELEGFVSVVAHDLRNPVCSALDSIQVIRDYYAGNPLDSRGLGLIGGAVTSLQRMLELIDALLDYAWTGRENVPMQTVDLNHIAAEVAVDLRSVVEANRARLHIGVLPEVSGDPVALRQLLQNLIANALKFRAEADPVVSVECSERPDAWVFSVADNGIGIPAEHLKNIFQPFQRLHARNEYEGSGLGLATCQRIVSQHGGKIWVESEPGRGSTFRFTCPKCADIGDAATFAPPVV